MKKAIVSVLIVVVALGALTAAAVSGVRFGFASNPDDPNQVDEAEPINTSVDTFQYDPSLEGTSITLLNSKAEIQNALVEMSAEFEKKSGVHVEVMPVTDGDSPYTKVVSLYNSGNPPTMSILDTTDVIALAEEKAADLSNEAWLKEAGKRGLSNLTSTADALPMYTAPKNVDLFVKHGIYTKEEIEARAEIHIENYSTVICIEARTMTDMIRRQILPAVSAFAGDLCSRAGTKKDLGACCQYEVSTACQIGSLTDALMAASDKLETDLSAIPADAAEAMRYSHDVLIPDMDTARRAADQLETLTSSDRWPFPTYSDLLFSV